MADDETVVTPDTPVDPPAEPIPEPEPTPEPVPAEQCFSRNKVFFKKQRNEVMNFTQLIGIIEDLVGLIEQMKASGAYEDFKKIETDYQTLVANNPQFQDVLKKLAQIKL